MQTIKSDIEGYEICQRNEMFGVNSSSILQIMDGDFPEWLLIKVLIRLPVKFIFRSKIVCKRWLSLILDPYFVRMYTSRASLLKPLQPWVVVSCCKGNEWAEQLCFLQFESIKNIYSRELKCPSYLLLRHLNSQQPYQKKCIIYGISNGLVLHCEMMQHSYDSSKVSAIYYICNPVTRQRIVLRTPICHLHKVGWGFLTQVEDGMLKSFRVVCIDSRFLRRNTTMFNVLFSERGEWKDFIIKSDRGIDIMGERPPTALHGKLHWLLRSNFILAYDPYQKPDELRTIPLPPDRGGECNKQFQDETTSLCGVSDGKLKYFQLHVRGIRHAFSSFEIWLLDDYGSGGWSLQTRVKFSDIHCDAFLCNLEALMLPIAFDPFDSDIVYLGYVDVIASYNIKTKRLEVRGRSPSTGILKFDPFYYYYPKLPWWTSLLFLIPPWPTSIPPSVLLRKDKLISPSNTL